ncbi:uncharacterized protein MJAP1_002526 [Malassezia japonica]|uniref:Sphingomyelin phosphodiesterase n=1 Tax=Malassezia japonica TaxID=223818 RepID=A0AAF0F772_9BASI|nr:uncharacterized protein MJAP1_002526 [Malassezia japonica]WFD39547.1 hypothetical protein MJAP1_002526 [Malassezia japonica]
MVHAATFRASVLLAVCACTSVMAASSSSSSTPLISTKTAGTDVYTAPSAFPTSEFPSMDFMPKSQEAEPRPVITRIEGGHFDDSLVNPTQLPESNAKSEGVLPKPSPSAAAKVGNKNKFRKMAIAQISELFDTNNTAKTTCDKCRKALQAAQKVAWAAPSMVPELMIEMCKKYNYTTTPTAAQGCEDMLSRGSLGGVYTQALSYANFSDGSPSLDYLCATYISGKSCDVPKMEVLSKDFLSSWFKGKPTAPEEVKKRSKKTGKKQDKPLRTLHVSDFHVDPRYMVGAEAKCTSGQCCRANSFNSTIWKKTDFKQGSLPKENISQPANYWGEFTCDPPWSLIASGMQGISGLVKKDGPLDLGIFTGDLTTHDEDNHISVDLVKYAEQSLYDMFHRHMGNATMVVALGNHDSSPADFAAPSNLPDGRADQFSWNYENVASLVKSEGWGNNSVAKKIRSHYGGYSVSPRHGLRIIALNSDFWYKGNTFSYLNLNKPDPSGMLRWFTDELQEAENSNERAWVVAHVPTGWDGGNSLDAPTNLFYHIVSRYTHTIAQIFFGHTHEDQFHLFYEMSNGNATSASRKTEDATAHAFLGPSLTPLSKVQPSLRIYDVDPETYEVMDYSQYFTPISEFKNLKEAGPVWHLLYKARETYSNFTASQKAGTYAAPVKLNNGVWPKSASLNASFWAALTDEMEQRPELVELHQIYQGRNSPKSWACTTDDCHKAKVCYMRSGSSSLGRACPKGYGSVQGSH